MRLAALSPLERAKFWRICPNVVVEILSASDAWSDLLTKLDAYVRNGATFVVAIEPFERRHAARGTPPDGFALDDDAIIDA